MKDIKVLIVEDDEDNLETLSTYLEFYNYKVLKAIDGEIAVNLVTEEKPDVILLDLMIPKIDGWEVAKKIKSNPQTRKTKIIAFSAMALPHEMERALNAGCDAFLAKPMSPDSLVDEMNKILNQ